jgi:hypothetical protein
MRSLLQFRIFIWQFPTYLISAFKKVVVIMVKGSKGSGEYLEKMLCSYLFQQNVTDKHKKNRNHDENNFNPRKGQQYEIYSEIQSDYTINAINVDMDNRVNDVKYLFTFENNPIEISLMCIANGAQHQKSYSFLKLVNETFGNIYTDKKLRIIARIGVWYESPIFYFLPKFQTVGSGWFTYISNEAIKKDVVYINVMPIHTSVVTPDENNTIIPLLLSSSTIVY